MRKRIMRTAGFAATLLAIAGAGANAADDGPPSDPRGVGQVPAEVQPVAEAWVVADEIRTVAEYEENGYAAVRVSEADNRVDLWWQGNVDKDVREVIDRAERRGVTVAVNRAVRSRAQMVRLGERLHRHAELKSDDITVIGVKAPPDQSGFMLAITRPGHEEGERKSATKELTKRKAEAITGVPVLSVNINRRNPLVPASRQDDYVPWWGGARMVSVRYDSAGHRSRCSTGFAVTYGQPGDDQARMLSAAHCALHLTSPTSGFHNIGSWDGSIEATPSVEQALAHTGDQLIRRNVDSLLLNTAGNTEGNIYTGTITSNSGHKVVGSLANNDGQTGIYTSGANSGQHGPLTIENDQYDHPCADHEEDWCAWGVIAQFPNGAASVAAGQGDSGGPVYSYISGSNDINARGIIEGILLNDPYDDDDDEDRWQVECGNLAWPGHVCASRVAYIPIRLIINTWGNIQLR